jgi:hypothetical protein
MTENSIKHPDIRALIHYLCNLEYTGKVTHPDLGYYIIRWKLKRGEAKAH